MIPRSWWWIALAVLVARITVLALSVPPDRPLTGDEPIYDKLAHNMIEGKGYEKDGEPYVQKPPGWPLILSAVHLVFGENRRAAVAVQGVLDAGTALLTGWTAMRVFSSPAAGAIAFFMVALWPPFLRESRLLQTEPLYALGIAALLAGFTRFVLSPGWGTAALMGCATGWAVMARPTGLVPAVGLLMGWLIIRRERTWPHALKLAAFALGVSLFVVPWGIRNLIVFDKFIPTGIGAGDLFFVGTMPETDGRWDHDIWLARKMEVFAEEEQRLGRKLNAIEEDHALMDAGLEEWKRHPGASVWRSFKRLYRLLLVPVSGLDRPWLRAAFLAVLLVLYGLALPRGIEGLRAKDAAGSIAGAMLIAIALTVAVSSMLYTNSRFFEPLRPMMMILASGTLARRL